MGLQEFFRGVRAHFRRYDAQQIVLHSDYVYCSKLVLVDYDLQRTCKLLAFLSFPMEIHSDRYSVKYEGRLCKHRRRRLGVEIQLIIKSSVVFDLTFAEDCLTHTSAVRKYLKLNLFARHYSHSDIRLLSGQSVQNTGFLFLGH